MLIRKGIGPVYCCILLYGLSIEIVSGQSLPDTALIRQWIDTAWDIRFDKPEYSKELAARALISSHNSYYFGILNSLQLIGEFYYGTGQLDSSIYYYRQALHYSLTEKDRKETGNNFTGLASIYSDAGNRDSSLLYYQKAIRLFEEEKDSSSLCDAWLRLGNVHNSMGHHNLALESYLTSLRISELIDREMVVAYNYASMGIVLDKRGEYPKAEEYFQKALSIFQSQKDIYGQMGSFNNLGILYKNMKLFEKSREAYAQSLIFADSLHFDKGIMSAHTNLGILNVLLGYFENALYHSTLGLQLAKEFQTREAISDNLNWIARAQTGLKDYENARLNAEESLTIAQEVQSLEKQRDANLTLSEIYTGTRNFERSLDYFKAFTVIKDSLFNAERSRQIMELQAIYETDKKDKEIQLLAKNVELDRLRKTRLWVALGLSMLAGGLLVHSQWLRRTRDKKILSQENELEIHRRKSAELAGEKLSRELDFKKQELAAKALQLARKNEFLQSLNEEVDKIRTHPEAGVADSARRISRQILMDIESEEEWEQFLASFREVHRDFIDHLQHAYPDISKSEIRLVCLMKMNLSAKELAALLNVTPDGIKKARYRLRKKMNLDSEVDIQEFLLAFPG